MILSNRMKSEVVFSDLEKAAEGTGEQVDKVFPEPRNGKPQIEVFSYG
jgi:hypothetical protein